MATQGFSDSAPMKVVLTPLLIFSVKVFFLLGLNPNDHAGLRLAQVAERLFIDVDL